MSGTKLMRLSRKKSRSLQRSAPESYWSLLHQLYQAHHTVDSSLCGLLPLIKARDFTKLLDMADYLSQQKYETAYVHYVCNQFAYLIKKMVLPSDFDPESRARNAFEKYEARCARTNLAFRSWCIDSDIGAQKTRLKYNELLRRMRSFIHYCIGDEPPLKEIFSKVGVGPGASLGVHGRATNAMRKLMAMDSLTLTPRAATYFAAAVHHNLWLRRVFSVDADGLRNGLPDQWFVAINQRAKYIRYNKIAYVPKTAKVLRTIAVEPLGNSILQKGVDLVLRQRLLRINIDLSDQTRNQEFARLGSLPDCPGLATIDLSGASDCVATEVIRKLFPPAWFELLNSIRSENYCEDESVVPYNKFSSMGNGTTFPVETLLFVAACHAINPQYRPGKDFTVYGDDIVYPSDKARDLLKLLRVLGFSRNVDKTFIDGPFRESCGEDWFGGVAVRPFVLDYALDSVQNIFKFLNQTKSRPLWSDFFEPARDYVLRLLPNKLHLYRPFPGAIDSAIDSSLDVCISCPHVRYLGNGVWKWRELVSRPRKDERYILSPRGMFEEPPDYVMWYGVHTLTSGINTLDTLFSAGRSRRKSEPWFTLRRAVKTAVTWESHGGASNLWLPLPR